MKMWIAKLPDLENGLPDKLQRFDMHTTEVHWSVDGGSVRQVSIPR